ncbi:hypothetical protein ACWCYY_34845 [Kitasatospora sp. NPDC001664]
MTPVQFLLAAVTGLSGPQADHLADACHNLYLILQPLIAVWTVYRLHRRTAQAAPAVPARPAQSVPLPDARPRTVPEGEAMTVIVLEESRKEISEDFGPTNLVSHIGQIHAAPADPADPDVPADPADRTFCGKDTAGMETLSYRPAGPGSSWYPQNLERWVCRDCDGALRTS